GFQLFAGVPLKATSLSRRQALRLGHLGEQRLALSLRGALLERGELLTQLVHFGLAGVAGGLEPLQLLVVGLGLFFVLAGERLPLFGLSLPVPARVGRGLAPVAVTHLISPLSGWSG